MVVGVTGEGKNFSILHTQTALFFILLFFSFLLLARAEMPIPKCLQLYSLILISASFVLSYLVVEENLASA